MASWPTVLDRRTGLPIKLFGVELGIGALVGFGALAIVTLAMIIVARSGGAVTTVDPAQIPSAPVPFHEFILADQNRELDDGFVFYRPRLDAWSDEQVAQYWQPVEDVVEGYLRRQNDRRIELLFADIP